MALKLILAGVLVLIGPLTVDSRQTRSNCFSRDINPLPLSPLQEANTEVEYLIERVRGQIIEKYLGNGKGNLSDSMTALSFRALRRKSEVVYLVKIELISETIREFIHTKIHEPITARPQVMMAVEMEHLFSPLGPCYVPNDPHGFGEELAFDDLKDKQLHLLVAVLLPKMKFDYPNLFGDFRFIQQLSHRQKSSKKGLIYLIRLEIEMDEPTGLLQQIFRYVHLTVLEPRLKTLNVESVQTDVEETTPIEWF